MLSYDAAGTGPALVLLHSTVCDRRMWDPQWPVLIAAGYQVVRCDFRGFGATPVPQGPHDDADDVVDLAGELSLGPVAVVGASYGGKVALEIAARWPRQVTALALLCAGRPGHEPSDTLRAFGRREAELMEAGDVAGAVELNVETWLGPEADEGTRDRVRQMQRHAFEVQLAAAEEYESDEVAVDLRAITAPSLVVSGAKDLPDFRQIAAGLAGLLPGAQLVELPWAGHLPTLERPHELSQLLTVFLRDAVPPGEPLPRAAGWQSRPSSRNAE